MCKVQKEKGVKAQESIIKPSLESCTSMLLNSITPFVLQPVQCMNSVCLLVQRILLMWVEGEGEWETLVYKEQPRRQCRKTKPLTPGG